MTGPVARSLGFVSVLVALGLFLLAELPALRAASGAHGVSRVRAYALGVGADPTFAVSGGDRLVRLVTNALVPREAGGDDVDYAIAIRIERPDHPPEERTLYLRSHRSGPLTGGPDPVFDPEGTPIADSRHVDLAFDPPAEPGTRLTVREVGTVRSLLRAWSSQPRAGAERAERMLALYPDLRERFGGSIGVGAWDHLAPAERAALTDNRFSRLAATGSPGTGYALREFYVRPSAREVDEAATAPLDLSRPVTWLVQGPAALSLRIAVPPEHLGDGAAHLTLTEPLAERSHLAAFALDAEHRDAAWSGRVEEGLHTLVLSADRPGAWVVDLVGPGSAQVPPTRDSALERFEPSVTRFRASRIGPGAPATFDAESSSEAHQRTLEIEVWSPSDVDPTLLLRTVTATGETEISVSTSLGSNPYDRYVDESGAYHALRGPERVRLLLPHDALTVEASASAETFVRFRVPFHDREDADNAPATTRQIGVDAGPATRSWVRAAFDVPEVEILVSGRVEALPPPTPPPPTWVAQSLFPRGFVPRFESLERRSPPFTGRVLTEVLPGRPTAVRASETGRASARWSYEVQDPAALGSRVPLVVDGEPAGDLGLSLTRGTYRLAALTPGEHTVAADPPPGVRLFVNVPPAPNSSATAYQARTVWRISAPLEIPVRVGAAGPRAVDLVVYDRSAGPREDVQVEVEVDGAHPRVRSSGAYTRATPARRRFTLPAAAEGAAPARLLDGDRAEIGLPRTLMIPLGDDLAPGTHVVRIRASRSVYGRAFALVPPGFSATDSPAFEALDE